MTSRLRSFKALALLAILFVVSLLMVVLPVQSGYSVPAQSCPNVQPKIQIIDESGKLANAAPKSFEDTYFKRRYVRYLSQHLVARVCELISSEGLAESSPEIKLVFAYRPLMPESQSGNKSEFNLDLSTSKVSRSLNSPWFKITMSKLPTLKIQAIFILNERQFLIDQALHSGTPMFRNHSAKQISGETLRQYFQEYVNSVMYAPSPEARTLALESITKRLPPEITWFFKYLERFPNSMSPDVPPPPIIIESPPLTRDIAPMAASKYLEPIKTLIDRFFASVATNIRYRSVLDLPDLFTKDFQLIQKHIPLKLKP
jgi:hypothetical protein